MLYSFLLTVFIFCSQALMGFDVSIREEGASIFLDVCPEAQEMICKDSIRVSLDTPGQDILEWESLDESEERYLVPLKLYKKVFIRPFTLRLALDAPVAEGAVYFSCFLVRDEEIVPVMKFLPLEREVSPVIKEIPEVVVTPTLYDRVRSVGKKCCVFTSSMMLYFVLLLLFILFIIFHVLTLWDLLILIFLPVWYYSSFFSVEVTHISTMVFCFIAGLWFFRVRSYSLVLSRTRLFLGLLCIAAIVPLAVEMYLVVEFGARMVRG